jgi:hypothetical protein
MRYILIAAVLWNTTPAAADWSLSQHKDPLTDKTFTIASATSNDTLLRVRCVNGAPSVDITFPTVVALGRLGLAYRFDDGPVIGQFGTMRSDGRELWPPWSVASLAAARRVRIQVPSLGGLMLDFTLGSGDPLRKVRC